MRNNQKGDQDTADDDRMYRCCKKNISLPFYVAYVRGQKAVTVSANTKYFPAEEIEKGLAPLKRLKESGKTDV